MQMIKNSSALQTILVIDMFALLMYNVSGMMVTFQIGAVFRTVLETMRTLFVWLVDLGLFYAGTGLGESWSVYSWVQAAGFVVLVCGTLVYSKGDEEEYAKEVKEAMAIMATEEPQERSVAPTAPGAATYEPVPAAVPSAPMAMAGSFKASQTIVAGSFHRMGSLPHGSLPRSLRTNIGSVRGHVVTHGAGTDSEDE